MSDANTQLQRGRNNKSVMLRGSFAPNGAGVVSNLRPLDGSGLRGVGFTVTRTGVGTFRVDLDAKYRFIRCFTPGIQLAVPANTMAQLTTDNVAGASPSFTLTVLTAGAAADVAAAAGNRVHFDLELSEDTVNA